MNKEPVFNPAASQQMIGLRIMNLPDSCTNELIYTQLFQKLKIDTKKVKAFRVRGDAFVYFDSEDSAQDAMNKIIGYELHGSTLNCSLLMPTQDLKLKNNKNVFVKNLSKDVSFGDFYKQMSSHGQVLSIYFKENLLGKKDGFASYKTETFAEKAEKEGITINGKSYICSVLKDRKNKGQSDYDFGALSRNIRLVFDKELINTGVSELELENQLRAQIEKNFKMTPTSVFVWGKNAKHIQKEQEKHNINTMHCGCINNEEGVCPRVSYLRKIAYVCFDKPNEAKEFVNGFYKDHLPTNNRDKNQKTEEQTQNQNLYSFQFGKEPFDQNSTFNTTVCVPRVKDDAAKQEQLKRALEKITGFDKSFIYMKNIKGDTTVNQITEAIEKNSGTQVLSIKLNAPTNETFIRDVSKKNAESLFATIQLKDTKESETFINQFKQNADFRNKFEFFENYKYANFLAPKKVHKQELKAKNEKSKNLPSGFLNPGMFPFFNKQMFNMPMFNNKSPIPPMMPPMMLPPNRFMQPMPFQNMNNNFNPNFKQNMPRGQSTPGQLNFNNNRPQNNQNNNQKPGQFNNNNNNFNNNRVQSQNRNYNRPPGDQQQQQQQYQQYQQQRRPQNFKGTALPPNQAKQHLQDNRKNNNIQKPATQPEKKQVITAPTQPPKQPIMQPVLPPQPIAIAIPKAADLASKSDEEKKQILGQCLLPKIKERLSEEQKQFVPKIAGMLLDFEVYNAEEIIEMLQNPEDLQENIETALELIQESNE